MIFSKMNDLFPNSQISILPILLRNLKLCFFYTAQTHRVEGKRERRWVGTLVDSFFGKQRFTGTALCTKASGAYYRGNLKILFRYCTNQELTSSTSEANVPVCLQDPSTLSSQKDECLKCTKKIWAFEKQCRLSQPFMKQYKKSLELLSVIHSFLHSELRRTSSATSKSWAKFSSLILIRRLGKWQYL